jgi:hypothetical protein
MTSNSFIDVHSFDGRLRNIITPTKYSMVEKQTKYNILKEKLKNQNSIQMVNIIESGDGNYQYENNLDASDLLVNILYKEYDEILPILEEQLSDMLNLGRCPSGRVTRLISILVSLT